MAFRMNPVTNKWEQVPAQGKGQPSPATAKTPTVNIGQARTTTANLPQATRVTSQTRPQRIAPTVTPRPTTSTTPKPPVNTNVGPQLNETVPVVPQQMNGQTVINAMWQALYDEADAYKAGNFGEDPPASWWTARMTPIEAAQKRFDASTKSQGDGGASDRAKAAKEEAERIRKIRGGRQGEAFLIEEAATRKEEMLKRVAELYDPLKTKSAEDLETVLQSASDAFDLAEKQVGEAQTGFEKQFKPSTAYEGVPISTLNVADNPLLAALQQQGAGTGEVQAATDYARQMGQSTSDLEKWALSQLNVGQQNYGSAVQNAAQMGTMAALQQLGGRRADVKTGIQQQFSDALAELAKQEVAAKSSVDETIADLISKANTMRADTMADYGLLPYEEKKIKQEEDAAIAALKPKVVTPPKPKAPVVNKPKAPVVVKKTPQQVEAERLTAMAKQYRK